MLSQKLRECGVVGAGGAGFPAGVKAKSAVEFVIANGAECEPLIHKDAELMLHFPKPVLAGMTTMMAATGAQKGKFGIKSKHQEAIAALQAAAPSDKIEFVMLGDFYPSGDEYELVYAATGRLIPAAGIPLAVGCVVNNVETLYNVDLATRDIPVTEKLVSVCGAVKEPKTFWTAIGVTFRELIAHAGGATVSEFAMFVSGIMMGSFSRDLDDVVTKTTAGIIVVPMDHYLVTRRTRSMDEMNHIGKSACDQCSYCTEFCPRYLLGYEVQPHKVMRSLGFTTTGAGHWSQWAELCCSCGLCTLYACPEDLYPKEACDGGKAMMRREGVKFVQQKPVQVHPMKEYRRVPQSLLRKRLKIEEYDVETPFEDTRPQAAKVRIKLKQHAGKPAAPVVKEGAKVSRGQTIAKVDEPDLGAYIHSSIDGKVRKIAADCIEIS